MEISDEGKARMYFDAIIAHKTRHEHGQRLRGSASFILVGLMIAALSLYDVNSTIFWFAEIYFIFTAIGIAYQMWKIKLIVYHYDGVLDDLAQPTYIFDVKKLRKKYIELRKIEYDATSIKYIPVENIGPELIKNIRVLYKKEFEK